jgi:hypothetical protein
MKGQSSKYEQKLANNNNETVTKAKIERAESANSKGVANNILHRKLTVKCSELPASF